MKTLFAALTLVLSSTLALAQHWHTDYEEAARRARRENKRLLIDFTGSDWCRWCIKLDREVFSTPRFKQYADHNLVLLKVDFPRRRPLPPPLRRQNEALARQYRITEYPTIVVQSPNGRPLQRFGYVPGGANAFIRKLEESAHHGPHRPPLRPGYRR